MKKAIFFLLCLFALQAWGQPNVPPQMQRNGGIQFHEMKGLKQKVWIYKPFGTRDMKARGGFSPLFLIFPDEPCAEGDRYTLIKDLGIEQLVKDYAGGVAIVNPVGKSWNNKADFAAYKAMIDSMRVISNLKIIAIGRAATFVNQTIANQAYEVAGIVSIGGKAGKAAKGAVPVPAYIAGKDAAKVAKSYIAINQAKAIGDGLYANSEEPLQRVAVSNGDATDVKAVVADAWTKVLSRNYRFNNFKHTFYMGAKFGQYGAYELEPYLNFEELGVKRNVVEQDLLHTGKLLWYEYLPKATQTAAKASTPLVLLLHGHGNDPRTQSETSGWIEVAAKENIIVAELEWQGNGYPPMGLDGIEQVVFELLHKYPQIDASRVYTEGLSAGAMTSTALGIRKSYLFAGIGAMSGGLFPDGFYNFSGRALGYEATQKRGACQVAYINVDGTDDDTIIYPTAANWRGNSIINAWQQYMTMNGLDVVRDFDFAKYPTFGMDVKDHQNLTMKHLDVETGCLYQGNVPMMKLVAVHHYGHWNFKPAAQIMWDYLKHFRRDLNTRKLIYEK